MGYESSLDPRVRETAVMAAAALLDCDYDWAAHEPQACSAGVSGAVIDAIRERRPGDRVKKNATCTRSPTACRKRTECRKNCSIDCRLVWGCRASGDGGCHRLLVVRGADLQHVRSHVDALG